ncbi:hypothetical protein GPECTOR_3g24 [Gonium pectorale]|uniref:Pentacotripeptide-repeat region of PRORP domain-containing protein n=1 Tax=Gonium pectorale TaxID=33097 RepID=A0A150GZ72_GONPE|nr:hypothetical protein GPECTOR_3g24 [Gonium pectorale]|eukprot:KXZ55084.1 hypothetical protein GPECTOR_3g24 [Gonium pectorale]
MYGDDPPVAAVPGILSEWPSCGRSIVLARAAAKSEEYHRQRESEHRCRERNGRHFTPFAWSEAAESVLADEAFEDEAAVVSLIRELGRQGCSEVALAALELVLARGCPAPSKRMFDSALLVCATEYRDEQCGSLFERMRSLGLQPDLLSANLLLSALCVRGRLGPALELLGRMRGELGVAPNSYSVLMVLQACNYKRRGAYKEAIEAVQSLAAAEEGVNEDVLEALLKVCEAAMLKAPSFDSACAVFRLLVERGLAGSPGVRLRAYNALLGAAGRAGAWREAQELYGAMRADGLPPSLETHTALIQASLSRRNVKLACVVGRALEHALELFEGLVAGRSASEAVPASIATYNHLIHACHQAGMLEKALEIASWVSATGVAFDDETYGELMATIDVAQLWDDKAMKQKQGAVLPAQLRPAPYDPMRIMYLDHLQTLQAEEALAREKLGGEGSWAPRSLTRGAALGPGPVPSLSMRANLSPQRSSFGGAGGPGGGGPMAAWLPSPSSPTSGSPSMPRSELSQLLPGSSAGGAGLGPGTGGRNSPLRRSLGQSDAATLAGGIAGQGQGSAPPAFLRVSTPEPGPASAPLVPSPSSLSGNAVPVPAAASEGPTVGSDFVPSPLPRMAGRRNSVPVVSQFGLAAAHGQVAVPTATAAGQGAAAGGVYDARGHSDASRAAAGVPVSGC